MYRKVDTGSRKVIQLPAVGQLLQLYKPNEITIIEKKLQNIQKFLFFAWKKMYLANATQIINEKICVQS